MPADDDFDLSKYVLRLSKRIAQITKDYIGIPFSTSNQLPFSIDSRPQAQSKYFGTTKKWQRGDPIIGYPPTSANGKRLMLNLPDGSTMIDLCYPGWEVAILDQSALQHFFQRRYLFGDYYAHLLTGRPLRQFKKENVVDAAIDGWRTDEELASARQAEIFQRRRRSLQEASEQQQQRGVSFDAQPKGPSMDLSSTDHSPASSGSKLGNISRGAEQKRTSGVVRSSDRILEQVTLGTRFVRDATTGISDNRLVIQKKYDTGEIEIIEKRSQNKIVGTIDCDLERILGAGLLDVFTSTANSSDESESDESNKNVKA